MDDLEELGALFQGLKSDTNPFRGQPGRTASGARWLQPEIVVEVDFAEFTEDGHIRHGVYIGRREDKPAASVTPERRKPLAAVTAGKVGKIAISNGDREIFPAAG